MTCRRPVLSPHLCRHSAGSRALLDLPAAERRSTAFGRGAPSPARAGRRAPPCASGVQRRSFH